MGWDVWGEAERRPGLTVQQAECPDGISGFWAEGRNGRRLIMLDTRLDERKRTEVLAHELVHDERCGAAEHPAVPMSWSAIVAREEGVVNDEVARRLVPRVPLIELIRGRMALGEGTSPVEVADRFGVSGSVARRALALLYDETGGRL